MAAFFRGTGPVQQILGESNAYLELDFPDGASCHLRANGTSTRLPDGPTEDYETAALAFVATTQRGDWVLEGPRYVLRDPSRFADYLRINNIKQPQKIYGYALVERNPDGWLIVKFTNKKGAIEHLSNRLSTMRYNARMYNPEGKLSYGLYAVHERGLTSGMVLKDDPRLKEIASDF